MEEKYDKYGNLAGTVLLDFIAGDIVEYSETRSIDKNKKTVVTLQGVWDGEKVEFDDKERTTVRAVQWLRLADKCVKCNRKF